MPQVCRPFLALLLVGAFLPAAGRELVLVAMSSAPTKEIARSQPLVDHLAAALEDQDVTGGRVLVLPTMAATAEALRERRADFFIGSPYPTLAIGAQAGTRIELRRWKNGKVDAAGIGIHDWQALRPAEREQLKIFRATDPVPRHLVSLRGDLEPTLAARLVQQLVAMNGTEAGRRVLAEFDATTRFDTLPDDARRTLEGMRRALGADGLPRPQP